MGGIRAASHTHCFYTVTIGDKLGASIISERGAKKRDEPFNPFAPNASAQRNKRQSERKVVERRPTNARPAPVQPEVTVGMSELAKKQRDAMERMKRQPGGSKSSRSTKTAPNTSKITSSVEKTASAQPQVSHEDRIAELRRKSELSRQNAKANAKPTAETIVEVVASQPSTLTAAIDPSVQAAGSATSEAAVTNPATEVNQSSNVFKTIATTVAKPSADRRRKRRRHDKKGGGRQKQEKKLNRQKYLEYKYAARAILDNPDIPEEHRSNVLGQVWAKGERMGVTDSLEFIDQKVVEEILPEGVAQKLRDLVNKMTTRR